MRLLKLYTALLASLQVHADPVGLLTHRRTDGHTDPIKVTVDAHVKRLVLPAPELLSQGIPDELVAFHPLSEMSNRGESEVFKKLKLLVSLRLTSVLAAFIEDLSELAVAKDQHKSASPKLLPLFEALSDADPKMVSNFMAVVEASLAGGKNRLLSIYLSRGGKHRGEKHARVAVVNFPILEELANEDRVVYGVHLRVKDVRMFKDFFEWLLPGSDQAGTYNTVSDSMDAPNFQALMRCYVKLAKQFNKIRKIATKHLDNSSDLHIDLDWEDDIDALETLRFEIPALDGNKGLGVGGQKDEPVELPTSRSVISHLQNRVSEPEIPAEPRRIVSDMPDKPAPVLTEKPKNTDGSSFNTNFSAADLRRQAMGIRTIQGAAPDAPATYHSNERRSLFDMGPPPAPPQDQLAWGHHAQSTHHPSVVRMHQPQNNGPFAMITQMANGGMPNQPRASGWGAGWSNV